ncbi:MAG TPA: nucleotidyltransferase family protein [Actinomycetota bacterium]|nr:nucleotidyltransferase family protein [Actinomycetota bacterium]
MGPTIADLPAEEIMEVARRYGVVSVRVFGSRARGDARPDSDLDLLIDVAEGTSLFDVIDLQNALKDLLGIKVEAVTEAGLHPMLRDDILREARPLVDAA